MVQPFVPRPIVALANFGAVEGERLSCSATVRYTECSVLSGELKNPMARLPVASIKPSASLRESKERMSMPMLSWVCATRVPRARARSRGRKHGAATPSASFTGDDQVIREKPGAPKNRQMFSSVRPGGWCRTPGSTHRAARRVSHKWKDRLSKETRGGTIHKSLRFAPATGFLRSTNLTGYGTLLASVSIAAPRRGRWTVRRRSLRRRAHLCSPPRRVGT